MNSTSKPTKQKHGIYHTQLSQKLITNLEIINEANPEQHFDQKRIFERYNTLKQEQTKRLGQYNLSDSLKKKLFGFSQSYFFTNQVDPYKMVIENHPMKGRIMMKDRKYKEYRNEKIKQRLINHSIRQFSNEQNQSLNNHDSINQSQDLSGEFKLPYDNNVGQKVIISSNSRLNSHPNHFSESKDFINAQHQHQ